MVCVIYLLHDFVSFVSIENQYKLLPPKKQKAWLLSRFLSHFISGMFFLPLLPFGLLSNGQDLEKLIDMYCF